jgi:L-lactate dehydrogenase complex protein LldG
MTDQVRQRILQRLQRAERKNVAARPTLPLPREHHLDAAQLKDQFMAQFEAQGGTCFSVADRDALHDRLAAIFRAEGITRAMATTDPVLRPLDLVRWGQHNGMSVVTPPDDADRRGFTRAVFDDVQAGITGVDFAAAESGTLILAHDRNQARLVSLAPLVHVAVVPTTRIVGTYDTAIQALFTHGRRPSQVSFITGPSMTGDIQGTMFKGMHGPQKIFALVLE